MRVRFARDRHRPLGNWIHGTGLLHVAGLKHRESNFKKFRDAARAAEKASLDYGLDLEPDPTNSHDRNAIMVIGRAEQKRFLRAPVTGRWHIGFVPREVSAELIEDVVTHGEPMAAELHNIYEDAGDLKVSFHVLIEKGSPAAQRRLRRKAGGPAGLSDDLTAEQRQLLRDRQMGLYRNSRLTQAEAFKKLGDFENALHMYLRVSWIDQSGPNNFGSGFDPTNVTAAPGITKGIAQAANTLGLAMGSLRERFIEAGQREAEAIAPISRRSDTPPLGRPWSH